MNNNEIIKKIKEEIDKLPEEKRAELLKKLNEVVVSMKEDIIDITKIVKTSN